MELEKNTQANNLYGYLGIGLRYSEILEFKSKDGGFPNYDHIRFLSYEKNWVNNSQIECFLSFALK